MNAFTLLPLVNILLVTLLAVVVLWRNPKASITRAFGFGALMVVIVEWGHFMTQALPRAGKGMFWYYFALVGVCYLPLAWSLVCFLLLQPNPKLVLRRRRTYLIFLGAMGTVFTILLLSGQLVRLPPEVHGPSWDSLRFVGWGRLFLACLLLTMVVMLIALENTYRNMRQRGGRHALLGLVVTIFYAVFLTSQGLLYSRIPGPALLIGSAILALTELLIAYDVIRYRLLQVEIYVGRGAIYSSAILLLIGVYLILMALVAKLVQLIGGNLSLFVTIFASFVMLLLLLVLLVSGSLKKRLRVFIDRNFYRGRYDYREQWLRFSEEMSSLLDLAAILPSFLQMVTETLNVSKACILLVDDSSEDFLLAESRDIAVSDFRIPGESEFMEWLFVLGEPIQLGDDRFDKGALPEVVAQRDRLKDLGMAVLIPLVTKRRIVGLLVLGPANSGRDYSGIDLELLEAIGNHLSMAILNAKLSEQLVLSKELDFIHKISSFVVHDLKNLVSALSMMLQNAADNMEKPEFRKSMLNTIEGTVNKMKGLMNKMTTMPRDFQLDIHPQDLNDILRGVISKVKINQMPGLQYIEDLQPLPKAPVDREHIERILTNLVVNALQAMNQQGTLRISTRVMENGSPAISGEDRGGQSQELIEIEVADTGEGMSDEFVKHRLFRPFQTTKKKGLGIGLFQSREAVQAHGGRIEVQSRVGQGTVFRIHLPLRRSPDDLKTIDGR